MGRLHHLRQTLAANLWNLSDEPDVEFVIVDYNSRDGLEDWFRRTYSGTSLMSRGRLVYARETTAEHWHVAKAKNLAHVLATGDVLVNVDADNFVSRSYVRACHTLFGHTGPGVYFGTTFDRNSSPGRVALHRDDFYRLGGYDEDIGGAWTGDDQDLMQRAAVSGLYAALLPSDKYIQHGHIERICNNGVPAECLSDEVAARAELERHATAGRARLARKFDQATPLIVANAGRRWGEALLRRLDGTPIDVKMRTLDLAEV